MDQREAIHAYFRAFKERDRAALEGLLTPDFLHLSPFGRFVDRDRMLDEIWPSVGQHWAEDIEVHGDGPAYMVRYRHSTGSLMAEYVRFEDDRIAEIEVYVGRSAADPATGEGR
jgi:ketosteroid isomerase-like protein